MVIEHKDTHTKEEDRAKICKLRKGSFELINPATNQVYGLTKRKWTLNQKWTGPLALPHSLLGPVY
jgi:hypothetical protein